MLIGLSGKIGCGKTFLANYFLEVHGQMPVSIRTTYFRLGFADILKEEAGNAYGYPNNWNYTEHGKAEIINHPDLPRPNMTIREVLQWHGTDYRREQDPDYWVKKMKSTIYQRTCGRPINIIIDDVRFVNEAEMIKKGGGILIRIDPYPEWKPGKFAEHKSETELDCYGGFDLLLMPEYGELKSCVSLIEQLTKGE